MTRDKLFQPVYAQELLRIAKGDLESAEVLASMINKGRRENICFAVQQSIDKALKALLCHKGKPIPLSHSIELILDRLGPNHQPPLGQLLIELTDYAAVKRYEEGHEIITDEDIKATLAAGIQTLTWVENQMGGIKAQ